MDRLTFVASGASFVVAGVTVPRRTSPPVTVDPRAAAYDPATPIPDRVLRNPIVGEMRRYDGAVAPPGWAFCDGRILAIAAYPKLFAVLGHAAGGGSRTTFALPRSHAGLPAVIAIGGWSPASPAALAAVRPGAPGSGGPAPSTPYRSERGRVPVAPKYPLSWPGTMPSAAFVANQERLMREASARTPSRPRY
jgi:hypothetical protein